MGLGALLIPRKVGSKRGLQAPIHQINSGETLEAWICGTYLKTASAPRKTKSAVN